MADEILARIERDRRYLEEARRLFADGAAAGVAEDILMEQFAQMSYDGNPIAWNLRSAHQANGNVVSL